MDHYPVRVLHQLAGEYPMVPITIFENLQARFPPILLSIQDLLQHASDPVSLKDLGWDIEKEYITGVKFELADFENSYWISINKFPRLYINKDWLYFLQQIGQDHFNLGPMALRKDEFIIQMHKAV